MQQHEQEEKKISNEAFCDAYARLESQLKKVTVKEEAPAVAELEGRLAAVLHPQTSSSKQISIAREAMGLYT